jgi:hypothetical protein
MSARDSRGWRAVSVDSDTRITMRSFKKLAGPE